MKKYVMGLVVLAFYSSAFAISASDLTYAHCVSDNGIDLEISRVGDGGRDNFRANGTFITSASGEPQAFKAKNAVANALYYGSKASSRVKHAHHEVTFTIRGLDLVRLDIDAKNGDAWIGAPYASETQLTCEIQR